MGRRSRALLLLSALSACSPAPEPAKPLDSGGPEDAGPFAPDYCKPSLAAGASAALTIGEGQSFYRDIVDDTALQWEKGPQGGHHVWIALRQKNLRRIGTIITIDLHDIQDPASPKLLNHSRLVFGFDRDEGGWCTLTGLRMQLDNAGIDLATLQNHRIEVKAKLDDPDGATASAVKTIIVSGLVD
ncbi:MAG: hypothetical protein ACXWUG_25535 [Polyangiales bacterium]